MAAIYKVGGCVRDKILGVETKDIDFTFVCQESDTVDSGWNEMRTTLQNDGFEIFLETPEMFTIRAKFPPGHKYSGLVADFVMARKEIGYIEGTRRPVLELGTLEDDLIRRDFTLNSLAETEDGEIIDLFGGISALEAGVLITPRDPMITLMDDPLRILRALRFSVTKGFDISESLWNAMGQPDILEKLKTTVSGERIREEIMKMMQADTVKSIGILHDVDSYHIPGFMELIFSRGLWLKPTFEKIKSK